MDIEWKVPREDLRLEVQEELNKLKDKHEELKEKVREYLAFKTKPNMGRPDDEFLEERAFIRELKELVK